ncbi:alanyl-tRNA editing protein [Gracilinema caldarium]|uniref:Threonyl/alanyl tRNA synthetase SAD n=1 Tax=Gracilinema caldarium (strain ATCC 51460 / DSM 7334 / H1) TaxID=744872 RepID=F8EWW9_GRAC1|nr:alanyl-tRNA editing protein [Gracilinema caldarium]AEJ18355.1 Threonyl/alanyl tRNA synthetase SAD [Gracilinema caldarium DSM 7334]
MNTEKLYYEQPYLQELDVHIIAAGTYNGRPALVLDKTIMYPEGGGQGADHGWINDIPVVDVQFGDGASVGMEGECIYHMIANEGSEAANVADAAAVLPLAPGPARLTLDRKRRQDLSTQHTAQHLLSATILRLTGAPTVSMHLGDRVNTIDVDLTQLTQEELTFIENSVQDLIREDYRIITHLCPPEDITAFPLRKKPPEGEKQLRIIEIDGYDYSPCAGIHLSSTGAIGALAVIGAEKYKGMMRIFFIAGNRVIQQYRMLRETAGEASRALKVPQDELSNGVAALIEKLNLQEKKLLILKDRLANFEAAHILEEQKYGKVLVNIFTDRSLDDALWVGRILQKASTQFVLVASVPELKVGLLTSRTDVDLRPVCKELLAAYGGSGGGGPTYFQGAFNSRDDLNRFIQGVESHEYFN